MSAREEFHAWLRMGEGAKIAADNFLDRIEAEARDRALEEAVRWVHELLDAKSAAGRLLSVELLRHAEMEPQSPCPHGRASWKMCPHCNGMNGMKEGE